MVSLSNGLQRVKWRKFRSLCCKGRCSGQDGQSTTLSGYFVSNESHTAQYSVDTVFETRLPRVMLSWFSSQCGENSSVYRKLCPNAALAASTREGPRGSMVMLRPSARAPPRAGAGVESKLCSRLCLAYQLDYEVWYYDPGDMTAESSLSRSVRSDELWFLCLLLSDSDLPHGLRQGRAQASSRAKRTVVQVCVGRVKQTDLTWSHCVRISELWFLCLLFSDSDLPHGLRQGRAQASSRAKKNVVQVCVGIGRVKQTDLTWSHYVVDPVCKWLVWTCFVRSRLVDE